MTKRVTFVLFLMISIVIYSCGSKDDECTKMMAIPHYYVENNQFQTYNVTEEVPCDFPEPEETTGPPEMVNFSYEVLYFTFIPDTGNNTSQLKFEIKLNNGNNYAVEGIPLLTTKSQGLTFTGSYSYDASVPCQGIAANSSCILTFSKEYPLKPDLGGPKTIELVDVKYYVASR